MKTRTTRIRRYRDQDGRRLQIFRIPRQRGGGWVAIRKESPRTEENTHPDAYIYEELPKQPTFALAQAALDIHATEQGWEELPWFDV